MSLERDPEYRKKDLGRDVLLEGYSVTSLDSEQRNLEHYAFLLDTKKAPENY